MLGFESSRNPDLKRRLAVEDILSRLTSSEYSGKELATRASALHGLGFPPLDALHLAAAEALACAYFVTCDDVVLRRARQASEGLRTRVVDPLEPLVLIRKAEAS